MVDRRSFLKILSSAVASTAVVPSDLWSRSLRRFSSRFTVHPFVEEHPDAVFIARTSVDVKTNSAKLYEAGYQFGASVFRGTETGGYPVSQLVAIKPNLTCRDRTHPKYTVEASMGIVTDAFFVEGIIDSMKELGIAGSQFFLREVNCSSDFADGGYPAMAQRTGADMGSYNGTVQWVDVPDGVWFRGIGYLWPVNAPDTLLLNIAKFKAHTMGLTLCAKNLQGTNIPGYQQHCTIYSKSMNVPASSLNPEAKPIIMENYNRHVAEGIPRWDKPTDYGGLRQETWATRCLDNNSVTKPALHIVEGVYGRDGNFMNGPGPDGLATDYMTNIILFGKNPFHVDIIGHWLGGHEPGNFGLFHMALERGLSKLLNPEAVPLYEWGFDGSATRRSLSEFERTPLKTIYLRRDYNGQSEDEWHLVDEPYDYGAVGVPRVEVRVPDTQVLFQNYPNPFNGRTTIQYAIPREGDVLLELYDIGGARIDVLVNRRCLAGSHLAVWNSRTYPSGAYFYRMVFEGHNVVKAMLLVK